MSDWLDIDKTNQDLSDKTPAEIIQWAVDQDRKIMLSTTFGPFSSVILHMVTQIKADIPVVWVDSGYNTDETYKTAEKIISDLKLNMHIYTPKITSALRDSLMGGVPDINSDLHAEFTRQVKLEPFQRALDDIKPDLWLTAIRKEETAYRQTLDVITKGPNDVIKVAPLLFWTELDMEEYLYSNELPQVEDYYDPTKAVQGRECGLHTMN